MSQTYLLKTEYLKDNGLIHGNVEDSVLSPVILRVQHKVIRRLLGTALYEKLLEVVQAYNNGDSPTTAIPEPYNSLLYKYVAPLLIVLVEKRSTTYITWRMRNAGVGNFNDQYFRTSTRQETTDLKQEIEEDVNEYTNDLITHLIWSETNGTNGGKLYPEYICGQHSNGGVDPEKKPKTNSNVMFIKGSRC